MENNPSTPPVFSSCALEIPVESAGTFPPLLSLLRNENPNFFTISAFITNSPLDNRAGILSLLPVPGPVTRPPDALWMDDFDNVPNNVVSILFGVVVPGRG